MPIQFTDRYDALGIPQPDPETMCRGYCEGMGIVPVAVRAWWLLWFAKRWRFVECRNCKGTGLRGVG